MVDVGDLSGAACVCVITVCVITVCVRAPVQHVGEGRVCSNFGSFLGILSRLCKDKVD